MYPNLKLEIFRRGLYQNRLGRALGINEVILSKIIHGHREPSEAQRKLIADYFQVDSNWLFERYDGGRSSTNDGDNPSGKEMQKS